MSLQFVMTAIVSVTLAGPVAAAASSNAPESTLLAVVVKGLAIVIVAGVLIYTVRCFLRPGERNSQHIKHRILHDNW